MLKMPSKAVERDEANELFFADFPHEFVGFERIDKYTLRKWLIGHAHMRGWTYEADGPEAVAGKLVRGDCIVYIRVVLGGLRLTCGTRQELIETRL